MPQRPPFGYKGVDGTCLWCGRPMPAYEYADESWNTAGKTGYRGNDHFCTKNCGYQFGLFFARNLGKKLKPKEGT